MPPLEVPKAAEATLRIGELYFQGKQPGRRLWEWEKMIEPENIRAFHSVMPTAADQARLYAQHAKWAKAQTMMALQRASRDSFLASQMALNVNKKVGDELDAVLSEKDYLRAKLSGQHSWTLHPLDKVPLLHEAHSAIARGQEVINTVRMNLNQMRKSDKIVRVEYAPNGEKVIDKAQRVGDKLENFDIMEMKAFKDPPPDPPPQYEKFLASSPIPARTA
eukprot:GEMP01048441.1.p1 GENE.GEMP01048441.1~~GEMP01048441.1.p1  ORF type:complete len:220 (+),score=49.17 GEMP01048441.1:100-759(+)